MNKIIEKDRLIKNKKSLDKKEFLNYIKERKEKQLKFRLEFKKH